MSQKAFLWPAQKRSNVPLDKARADGDMSNWLFFVKSVGVRDEVLLMLAVEVTR